ncbi:MAG: SdrD B-like domain-containing protein [Candidatus Methanoperedens sp.]
MEFSKRYDNIFEEFMNRRIGTNEEYGNVPDKKYFTRMLTLIASVVFIALLLLAQTGSALAAGGSISGMKFRDFNNNGINDKGEQGLEGWTINLTNESGSTISNITDTRGKYNFTGLADGNYTVREIMQSGWLQTAPGPSTNGSATYKVQINGSNMVNDRDFGNQPISTGSHYSDQPEQTSVNNIESGNLQTPDGTPNEIPEFPTISLAVASVIGLMFLFQRKGK